MTARDTFTASVSSATATKAVAVIAAVSASQETINASRCNVGYNLQTGNYANLLASVNAANIAKAAAVFAAEQAKQNSINVAKDTLRATGDVAPA